MYIRPVHAELDVPTLHAFIRKHPLGLLTTSIKHQEHATIQTSHIPFVLDADTASHGALRGHIARANPQCKVLLDAMNEDGFLDDEVLVLFNAPVHSYVTPKFYTETKPTTGKVVPTWDYAAVQVYGRLRVHPASTPTGSTFLQNQIQDLTKQQEAAAGHGEKAWKVGDAPERYIDLLKKAIVGMEIEVTRIEGRFKLSQENGDGDWSGVVRGFNMLNTHEGNIMAEMVEERGQGRGLPASALIP